MPKLAFANLLAEIPCRYESASAATRQTSEIGSMSGTEEQIDEKIRIILNGHLGQHSNLTGAQSGLPPPQFAIYRRVLLQLQEEHANLPRELRKSIDKCLVDIGNSVDLLRQSLLRLGAPNRRPPPYIDLVGVLHQHAEVQEKFKSLAREVQTLISSGEASTPDYKFIGFKIAGGILIAAACIAAAIFCAPAIIGACVLSVGLLAVGCVIASAWNDFVDPLPSSQSLFHADDFRDFRFRTLVSLGSVVATLLTKDNLIAAIRSTSRYEQPEAGVHAQATSPQAQDQSQTAVDLHAFLLLLATAGLHEDKKISIVTDARALLTPPERALLASAIEKIDLPPESDLNERLLGALNPEALQSTQTNLPQEQGRVIASNRIKHEWRLWKRRTTELKRRAIKDGLKFAITKYQPKPASELTEKSSKIDRYGMLNFTPVDGKLPTLSKYVTNREVIGAGSCAFVKTGPRRYVVKCDRKRDNCQRTVDISLYADLQAFVYSVDVSNQEHIAKNAGTSIATCLTKVAKIPMRPFMKASADLQVLHQRKIYHLDIKSENMTYAVKGAELVVRFVDCEGMVRRLDGHDRILPVGTIATYPRAIRAKAGGAEIQASHRADDEYAFILVMMEAIDPFFRRGILHELHFSKAPLPHNLEAQLKEGSRAFADLYVKPEHREELCQFIRSPMRPLSTALHTMIDWGRCR